MADIWNMTMLVGAALGSMAMGVAASYGIFRWGFALMHLQRRAMTAKVRS